MSFFYDAFNEYYLKNKTTLPDGMGGYYTTWENGAIIKMSLDLGGSSEIRQAQAQNLKTVFTASFPIDTPVTYDNYLEDVETGEKFTHCETFIDNFYLLRCRDFMWFLESQVKEMTVIQ